jgi:hypothetical protein
MANSGSRSPAPEISGVADSLAFTDRDGHAGEAQLDRFRSRCLVIVLRLERIVAATTSARPGVMPVRARRRTARVER